MEIIKVSRTNKLDLEFKGVLIASAATSSDRAMGSSYSGTTGEWEELAIYKSEKGKFICERIQRTQWAGRHDVFDAAVCETDSEIIEFFGHGDLASDIYYDAKIKNVQIIE